MILTPAEYLRLQGIKDLSVMPYAFGEISDDIKSEYYQLLRTMKNGNRSKITEFYAFFQEHGFAQLAQHALYQRSVTLLNYIWNNLLEHGDHGRIADVGCGDGLHTGWYALNRPEYKIVGYDLSVDQIAAAQARCNNLDNVTFAVSDVALLTNQAFDGVIASYMLHELGDINNMITGLFHLSNMCAIGGRIITVLDYDPEFGHQIELFFESYAEEYGLELIDTLLLPYMSFGFERTGLFMTFIKKEEINLYD